MGNRGTPGISVEFRTLQHRGKTTGLYTYRDVPGDCKNVVTCQVDRCKPQLEMVDLAGFEIEGIVYGCDTRDTDRLGWREKWKEIQGKCWSSVACRSL